MVDGVAGCARPMNGIAPGRLERDLQLNVGLPGDALEGRQQLLVHCRRRGSPDNQPSETLSRSKSGTPAIPCRNC